MTVCDELKGHGPALLSQDTWTFVFGKGREGGMEGERSAEERSARPASSVLTFSLSWLCFTEQEWCVCFSRRPVATSKAIGHSEYGSRFSSGLDESSSVCTECEKPGSCSSRVSSHSGIATCGIMRRVYGARISQIKLHPKHNPVWHEWLGKGSHVVLSNVSGEGPFSRALRTNAAKNYGKALAKGRAPDLELTVNLSVLITIQMTRWTSAEYLTLMGTPSPPPQPKSAWRGACYSEGHSARRTARPGGIGPHHA
ncbi:hypothetical protein JZ751_019190 [Albula glossodonta]|uniref:Uncharacterized protein n=1 Tax=Albula glossodonta TaxID=121402 RepID=A0A8T2NKV7_9TELE|nr:hypothetical protein JZ751_019190 [Albula glossodonta]